ncbi:MULTISPECIES: V-type ATP synthase subunit E [unclassified Methanoregula]|uniref:V-type ATP synthase subunit E n=1 Tax=unclassified Methanoregula TaxID=2649730 RepID=UPI0009C7602C|nr:MULTISPECIES: V-type ATP synthase subunit E [unclassified Methanoregula]OPX63253.1 MAG: V-type ATP synthase subunit E [Methanoregula sp. PtaB.Bin085]OPY35001.1 MAG: V-type ATP synthase subunit E [Methanoregula sp. PtaU1.Bin006]
MAYEDLLKSVEESAHEKEQELRNRQTAVVDEIRARARKQAGAVRQGHLDEAARSISAERNKLLYLAKAEKKEMLIRVRESAFEQAFAESVTRLKTLRADPEYPAVFDKLLREAAAAMGNGAFVVHIDPRDEALCKQTLLAQRISPGIRADISTSGGLVAALPDNSIVISNTVESRLERVRELKRKEIHAILFGE